MSREGRRPLGDLRENLRWIIRYSDSIDGYMEFFSGSYEEFLENEMFQDCCLSKISQIAECLNRISKNHRAEYEMYFVPIVGEFHGMRDIVVHQYENLNLRIIWVFLTKERPMIKRAAEECLERIDDPDGTGGSGSSRAPHLFRVFLGRPVLAIYQRQGAPRAEGMEAERVRESAVPGGKRAVGE